MIDSVYETISRKCQFYRNEWRNKITKKRIHFYTEMFMLVQVRVELTEYSTFFIVPLYKGT